MSQKFVAVDRSGNTETFFRSEIYEKNIMQLYHSGLLKIFCACKYPECELEYKFSVDGKLYPAKQRQNFIHNYACPANVEAKEIRKYNKAFHYIDDEKQEGIIAKIAPHNFSASKTVSDYSRGNFSGSSGNKREIDQKLTLSAFFKKMNYKVFEEEACSAGVKKYLSADYFEAYLYYKFRYFYINTPDKSLRDINNDERPSRYVYFSFDEIQYSEMYDEYKIIGKSHRYSRDHSIMESPTRLTVPENVLMYAQGQFRATYNGLTVEHAKELGLNVMVVGVVQKLTKYTKAKEIYFLLVNKNGLYCESSYEVRYFDLLLEEINRRNEKQRIIVRRPWERGQSLYTDGSLEDGIVEYRNSSDRKIIEIFGMQTDEYKRKRQKKIDSMGDLLIRWDPAVEKEPDFDKVFMH